jgi:hypothetical protein
MHIDKFNELFPLPLMEKEKEKELDNDDADDKKVKVKSLKNKIELNPKLDTEGTL